MEIRRIFDTNDSEIVALVAKSDEYLSSLYPPESNHAEPLEALIAADSAFFVGYIEDVPVACGGIVLLNDDICFGEIKRVFVERKHRGKRLATAVIQHLEDYLLQKGITVIRLEAGPLQPAALGLYRRLGYRECGPFGKYSLDPLSVFMEKELEV